MMRQNSNWRADRMRSRKCSTIWPRRVHRKCARLIAANPSAPRQADLLLAGDADDDVRLELSRKIGRLLPDLSPAATTKIRELTIETLEKLAADRLPQIRQIVAEEICDSDWIPPKVIYKLARDSELLVCGPILEYSPLLSDYGPFGSDRKRPCRRCAGGHCAARDGQRGRRRCGRGHPRHPGDHNSAEQSRCPDPGIDHERHSRQCRRGRGLAQTSGDAARSVIAHDQAHCGIRRFGPFDRTMPA